MEWMNGENVKRVRMFWLFVLNFQWSISFFARLKLKQVACELKFKSNHEMEESYCASEEYTTKDNQSMGWKMCQLSKWYKENVKDMEWMEWRMCLEDMPQYFTCLCLTCGDQFLFKLCLWTEFALCWRKAKKLTSYPEDSSRVMESRKTLSLLGWITSKNILLLRIIIYKKKNE